MDKTTKDFAESLALKECVCGTTPCSHKMSYVGGYLRAIEETNVKQLQEENERLREALERIEYACDGQYNADSAKLAWTLSYNAINNRP